MAERSEYQRGPSADNAIRVRSYRLGGLLGAALIATGYALSWIADAAVGEVPGWGVVAYFIFVVGAVVAFAVWLYRSPSR